MAEFDAKLQELLKNKKIIIPAAIIGGVLGLYVLSKQSGGGNGGIGLPENPGIPPAGGDTGGGSGGGDTGAISARIDEIAASQTGFQQQITAALQALADSLGGAINQVRGENQSALQSVIDQVNSQLAAGQAGSASIPDFAGFQSQLLEALGNSQLTPSDSGKILQQIRPRISTGGKSLWDQLNTKTSPSTFNPNGKHLAPSPENLGIRSLGAAFRGVQQRVQQAPRTPVPRFNPVTPGGAFGRLVRPSAPPRTFGAGTGINEAFAAGFNKLSGSSRSVPAGTYSRVVRSYTPAPFRTIAPSGFRRTNVLRR